MQTIQPKHFIEWPKRFAKRLLYPAAGKRNGEAPLREHVWSIGIYVGESPFKLCPTESIENPVLTRQDVSDIPAAFVADPFMLRVDDDWYMFFEVANQQAGKAEIGLAISRNGSRWSYKQVVLSEPFHLSYPYVFEWKGDFYMIPESYKARSVRLYKALNFPLRWSLVGTLMDGGYFVDASVLHRGGYWWLFTETDPGLRYDTLRLYYAKDLEGPWLEHPASPIIRGNPHIARPAGRVLDIDDHIIRYAQDCHPIYGTQVRAFEIADLTTTTYQEREVSENPVLTGSGTGWNACGMHHVDPHPVGQGEWIACVDGFKWNNNEASFHSQ